MAKSPKKSSSDIVSNETKSGFSEEFLRANPIIAELLAHPNMVRRVFDDGRIEWQKTEPFDIRARDREAEDKHKAEEHAKQMVKDADKKHGNREVKQLYYDTKPFWDKAKELGLNDTKARDYILKMTGKSLPRDAKRFFKDAEKHLP